MVQPNSRSWHDRDDQDHRIGDAVAAELGELPWPARGEGSIEGAFIELSSSEYP